MMRILIKPAGFLVVFGISAGLLLGGARLYLEQSSRHLSLAAQTSVLDSSGAVAKLVAEQPVQGGLNARYFGNAYLDGAPVFSRTDPSVCFHWGKTSPGAPLKNEQFSVRWQGYLKPLINGEHHFTVRVNDGARLWVNNELVVDLWRPAEKDRVVTGRSNTRVAVRDGVVRLQAGHAVPIRLDYYQDVNDASVELLWSYPGQPKQYLPASRLSPRP